MLLDKEDPVIFWKRDLFPLLWASVKIRNNAKCILCYSTEHLLSL